MKCSQCGTEFEGKFCPECGEKAPAEQQTPKKAEKKKKPFFLRWWVILLAVVAVLIFALSSGDKGEKIEWEDMILGHMLPEPPNDRGDVNTNWADSLWVDIYEVSAKAYNDYAEACKAQGFTVDAQSSSGSFNAKNTEGYSLSLYYASSAEELNISLHAPTPEIEPKPTDSIPDTTEPAATQPAATTPAATEPVATEPKPTEPAKDAGIDPEFKAAMTAYENFMNDYVAFMKKYQNNPNDLSLVLDYAKFAADYLTFCNEFAEWENEDLNDEEMAYYLDVQVRVNKKLLEVAT